MAQNKLQTFVDSNNEVVATGRITPSYIDLLFADGTRYYSTFSFDAIKDLDIKVAK
jgi:hypothetical protein